MNATIPATILIVDDIPANLGVVVDCLEAHGYRVLVAQDGDEGILRAELAHPELILLDVMMPGLDGFAACRRLKASAATRDIPVIFMTALADTDSKLDGFAAGGVDYVTKPLEMAEVLARVNAHLAVAAVTAKLEGITSNLFEGVLVIDPGGMVTFSNPSAQRLLRQVGEMEGKSVDALFRLRSEDRDLSFTRLLPAIFASGAGALADHDAQFVTPSGTVLSVAYTCSPLKQRSGIRGAILSFRDIEAVKVAQRNAAQASRLASVGQLAAGIAHEINTPVQYIGDNLRFIEDSLAKLVSIAVAGQEVASVARHGGLEEAAGRFEAVAKSVGLPFLTAETPTAIQETLDGVAQIARIVLSMKEFSQPGISSKTMTDINRALASTLTVSHSVWGAVAEVETSFDATLPPVLCYASEINQVFLNLIVNAAQAIEGSGKPLPGRITVTTGHGDGYAEIRIADNGAGIPPANRDRIFDPFFTTKAVGKGAGLGLAICRDVVVVKHGGGMEVAGEAGDGAVFIVRLPIKEGDP